MIVIASVILVNQLHTFRKLLGFLYHEVNGDGKRLGADKF